MPRAITDSLERLPLHAVCQIDAIARDVERRWRRGDTPRLEDYFDGVSREVQSTLLEELLFLEFTHRRRRGERLRADEFVARFPDAAELIQQVLDESQLDESGSHESGNHESGNHESGNQESGNQESRSAAPPQRSRLPNIPGYEILRQIGRGAMGVVYLARQERLNRLVALKLMAAHFQMEQALAVIRAEAEVIARLNHANIVQIFEVGADDHEPYLALEYVAGETLRDRMIRERIPTRESVELVEHLALAIHHAHTHGIVHRDLKPANVLLASVSGVITPKITDFGLAKVLDMVQDHSRTGSILGTPKYMAPEQAEGRSQDVGPATDVHALGVILFELLAGNSPFDAESPLDLLRQISIKQPTFRESDERRIPPDLQAICLKCLEKSPTERYLSASELADDLRRSLDGYPVRARLPSRADAFFKLVRRNKLASSLVATIFLFLISATVMSLIAVANIKQLRVESSTQAANLALDRGLSLCEQGDVATGLLWMARSLEYAAPDDVDLQRAVRVNLSSWSKMICPLVATLPHEEGLTSVACSSNCQVLLTGSLDGTAKLWNLRTGSLIAVMKHNAAVNAVALSPDGKLALTGSRDSSARLWSASTGTPKGPPLAHHEAVTSVAFSANGRMALTGSNDGRARRWDVATGSLIGEPLNHGTAILWARFVADDRRIATCGGTRVNQWDTQSGLPLGVPFDHPDLIRSAVASLDGKKLLVGTGTDPTRKGEARLWDLESAELYGSPIQFDSIVSCVAWSPDGTYALAGTQSGSIRLWDVRTGAAVTGSIGHENEVRAAMFSPDGKRVLTGSFDGTARLWDAATGEPLGVPMWHRHHVFDVAFSQDGQLVVTGSQDGDARLWDVANCHMPCRLLGEAANRSSSPWSMRVQFSPDGRRVLTGNQYGVAQVWSAETGLPDGPAMAHPDKVTALSFRPDGRSVGIGCADGTIRFWDVDSGVQIGSGKHEDGVTEIVYSPDGRRVLSASHDGTARFWDSGTGQPLYLPLVHPQPVWYASFSGDGRLALTGCGDGFTREWDVATGHATGREFQHPYTPWESEFSSNDRFVLTGCGPSSGGFGQARIWDVHSERTDFRTLAHSGAVAAVAWSADDQFVVTASFDRTAQLWETASGKPALSPFVHRDRVWDAIFSPDGQVVLTVSDDHTARLWDVRTGRLLGTPFRHPEPVRNAAFSSDSTTIVTGCVDDRARLWIRPSPISWDARHIQLWILYTTGMKLDSVGVPKRVDKNELESVKRLLNALDLQRE